MSATGIEDKFFAILASLLGMPRDQLSRETSRRTLEAWDSLKHMHLILAIEEEFGVTFDDHEIAELSSATALVDAIAVKVRS